MHSLNKINEVNKRARYSLEDCMMCYDKTDKTKTIVEIVK